MEPELTESAPPAIGIDFGGTSVKLGLVRGDHIDGEILRIPTRDHPRPESLVEAMGAAIDALREACPGAVAAGIGVPGAVDFEKGMTYNLTNVPGWSGMPLRDIVARRSGLPAVLENDANCAAYAEFKRGAARGLRNVVVVTLGTGVGGGLILNGGLYRGSQHAAGEIGQVTIDYRGVDGPYGNRGALERYVGHQQISELAARRFAEAGRQADAERCAPESLARAASGGDSLALSIWGEVAERLAPALADTVYLLNPDAIVLGGGVAHAGRVLFDPVRERLRDMLSPEFFEALQVIPARFGNTAGIIGSAALALEAVGGAAG